MLQEVTRAATGVVVPEAGVFYWLGGLVHWEAIGRIKGQAGSMGERLAGRPRGGKRGRIRRSGERLDVWVIEDEGIGGDEGHAPDARGGDEDAVDRIAVDGFGQGPGFLNDFAGDGFQVPAVDVEQGAEPGLPVTGDLNSPALLQAGNLANGNGRAPDLGLGSGDPCKCLRAESIRRGAEVEDGAGVEQEFHDLFPG